MMWKGYAFPSAWSLTAGSWHSGAGSSTILNLLFRIHRMHISRVSNHISVLASDIPSLGVDGAYRCLSTVTMEISSEFVLPACEIKPLNWILPPWILSGSWQVIYAYVHTRSGRKFISNCDFSLNFLCVNFAFDITLHLQVLFFVLKRQHQ